MSASICSFYSQFQDSVCSLHCVLQIFIAIVVHKMKEISHMLRFIREFRFISLPASPAIDTYSFQEFY